MIMVKVAMKHNNKKVPTLAIKEIKNYVMPDAFELGMELFKKGRVRSFHVNGNIATARVKDIFNHHIKVTQTEEKLIFSCCCYFGRINDPCHHVIAASLYWHKKYKKNLNSKKEKQAEFHKYLLTCSKKILISRILDGNITWNPVRPELKKLNVFNDEHFDRRKWKKLFRKTVKSGQIISDYEAPYYARNLEYLIDALLGLPQQEYADTILMLAEYALSEISGTLDYIEDYNDHIGLLLHKIQKLHLAVCKISQPNPLKIAKILFKWQREDKCDVTCRDLTSYIDVMGDKGVSKYRALAEADWSKTCPIGPYDFNTEDWVYENNSSETERLDIDNQWDKWGSQYSITAIMTELEKLDGDLNSLADIMAHDLSTLYNFIKIAQLYQKNGFIDKALEWAEKGFGSFGGYDNTSPDFITFIVNLHLELGHNDQAMSLAWASFKEWPTLGTYLVLENHAIAANQKQKWRDKTISHTKKQFEREGISDNEGYSLIVDIALHEGEVDTAWDEANKEGCYNFIWLSLAQARGKKHPEDAIQICQEQVNILIQKKKVSKSERELIIKFLECMKPLSDTADDGQSFKELIIKIQTQEKQIKPLINKLESKGWLK